MEWAPIPHFGLDLKNAYYALFGGNLNWTVVVGCEWVSGR